MWLGILLSLNSMKKLIPILIFACAMLDAFGAAQKFVTGTEVLSATNAIVRPPPGTTTSTITAVNSTGAPSAANTLGVLSFEVADTGPLQSHLVIKGNSGDVLSTFGLWTSDLLLLGNDLQVSGVIKDAGITSPANGVLGVDSTGEFSEYKAITVTALTNLNVGSLVVSNKLTINGPVVTPSVTPSASDIDLSTGKIFTKNLSGNTTFTFSNPTSGQNFTVIVTNSSTYTVTWPTVHWIGGGTPTQSSANTDFYDFFYDGSIYHGAQTPGSVPGVEQEAYSAGTVYVMTATPAFTDFGTTDPTITVATAGTYLIHWGANVKYNAATYAGNQTFTVKVRRTNNTAADITNATVTQTTRIITTITDNAGLIGGKPVQYVAAAGDILQVWGSVSATPAAGSVDVTDAWIVIVRIQ